MRKKGYLSCLLYTSDAADDLLCVDLGGRRIIKKKKEKENLKDELLARKKANYIKGILAIIYRKRYMK